MSYKISLPKVSQKKAEVILDYLGSLFSDKKSLLFFILTYKKLQTNIRSNAPNIQSIAIPQACHAFQGNVGCEKIIHTRIYRKAEGTLTDCFIKFTKINTVIKNSCPAIRKPARSAAVGKIIPQQWRNTNGSKGSRLRSS